MLHTIMLGTRGRDTMELETICNIGMSKYKMAKQDPIRFFVRSIVAGLYLGIATILSYIIGSMLLGVNEIVSKIAYAGTFGIGLVCIILLGAELFTGNCFTTIIPVYAKRIKLVQIMPMWIICYIGNFIGIFLLSFLFIKSGAQNGFIKPYLASMYESKIVYDALGLFIKGILCNFIVCVAAYSGIKCKSETAKIILVFVLVMTFVLSGFDHSIANMGTFSLIFTQFGTSLSWGFLPMHMLLSTLGNIIGGSILLGVPIYLMIKE